MANFENSPEQYVFGKLTFERTSRGKYDVSVEGIDFPVATVVPYDQGQRWGWVHDETGFSGMVDELPAAGAAIAAIEDTRS